MKPAPRIGLDVLAVALVCGLVAGALTSALSWTERPPVDLALMGFVLVALPCGVLAGWLRSILKAR